MTCKCIKKMGKNFQTGELYTYEVGSILNMTYIIYDKDYNSKEITFEEFKKYFDTHLT